MNLRDPIYRVKRDAEHTGKQWKVYPMYDYAHALTDATRASRIRSGEFASRRRSYRLSPLLGIVSFRSVLTRTRSSPPPPQLPSRSPSQLPNLPPSPSRAFSTLEFEDHRPLYDWVIENLPVPATPRQIEFSRLNLQYCVVSAKLIQLVDEGHVNGWDDPRMPTICGLRRRGVPPEALRLFVERTGV